MLRPVLTLLCLVGWSVSIGWTPVERLPGKLIKAFEALEMFNYFEAKQLFEQRLTKNTVPASYGLSVIYGRDDNPFTNIDSARKYIYLADSLWFSLEISDISDLKEVSLDSVAIVAQKRHVDSIAFNRAMEVNQLDYWNGYILLHTTPEFNTMAISERNSLAFRRAANLQSSAAYAEFLNAFPDASQADEAKRRYEKLLYKEITQGERLRDFQQYIETYPDGPYVAEAEDEIFERFTESDTPEIYQLFIQEYPDNKNTVRAWRRIYTKEIGDESPRSIAAFSLKYPNYPFIDELQQNFELAATRYYAVKQGDKWGFIDEHGTLKIPVQYEWNEPFKEGLAMVSKNGKVSFVEKTGNHITDFMFDDAFSFRNGHAVVEIDGMQGLIDRVGIPVVAPEYEECGEFSEGFVYVSNGEKFAYIDAGGAFIVDFIYDDATDFSAGMAIVEKDGLKGFIDKSGQLVIDCIFDWVEPFKNGMPVRFRQGEKYGLVRKSGEIALEAQYDQMGEQHEGMYLAANDEKYGFVNASGDTVVPFTYAYSQKALLESKYTGGYAKVFQKDRNGTKVGVIDSTGKKVMPAIFDEIGPYAGNLIPVSKKGKWGYADLTLNLAIPYDYDAAFPFQDSIAKASKKGMFGVIDTTGNPLIDFIYRDLAIIDTLVLVADTAYGVITISGKELITMVYADAEVLDAYILKFTDAGGGLSYYDYRRKKFIWKEDD